MAARLVVVAPPEAEAAAREAWPHVIVHNRARMLLGSVAYVAASEEHLRAFDAWFPGVAVRARARCAAVDLGPRDAVYLPVSFREWVVVARGPAGFGAASEAARLLRVDSVLAFADTADDVRAMSAAPAARYTRAHDVVRVDG